MCLPLSARNVLLLEFFLKGYKLKHTYEDYILMKHDRGGGEGGVDILNQISF